MLNENTTLALIKERFTELPKEVRSVITAPEFIKHIKETADRNGLMLDQLDSLQKIILVVMLGLEPASTFVSSVMQELAVGKQKAETISRDVNLIIFGPIREHLKEWEDEAKQETAEEQPSTQDNSAISTIESVGDFKIEKEDGDETAKSDVTPDDREKILSGLENPPLHSGAVPPNLPVSSEDAGPFNDITAPKTQNSSIENHENHTEPIVDYLLSNPAGQGQKKVVVETKDTVPQPQTITKPPLAVQQRRGPDPYREAVK